MTNLTADQATRAPRFGSNAATLIARNLRIYFRDKTAVFLSLLSPVILLFLYLLFLGSLQVNNVAAQFPQAETRQITAFVNAWVFAGMVAITPSQRPSRRWGPLWTTRPPAGSGSFGYPH